VVGSITEPVILEGGDGDDHLLAGLSTNALLSGGDGDDRLQGSLFGRNVLIGGDGRDRLHGGLLAENLLIGGRTTHDTRTAALEALLAEWSSPRRLEDRVENLTSGGGLNGDVTLEARSTVLDDGLRDKLFGGLAQDWLLGDSGNITRG
jgi:Ca2+-binding RTX toxin-like protein